MSERFAVSYSISSYVATGPSVPEAAVRFVRVYSFRDVFSGQTTNDEFGGKRSGIQHQFGCGRVLETAGPKRNGQV